MTPKQKIDRDQIRRLARSRCKVEHPDFHDSLICVGPGSGKGFGPPCDECLFAAELAYKVKEAKEMGVELSKEEIRRLKSKIGLT